MLKIGIVDGLRTGDDVGAQGGRIISPEMFIYY